MNTLEICLINIAHTIHFAYYSVIKLCIMAFDTLKEDLSIFTCNGISLWRKAMFCLKHVLQCITYTVYDLEASEGRFTSIY